MEINYLAVLVATIAAYIVGALWYGPIFGKKWRELMGVNHDVMTPEMKSMMWKSMSGGFIVTLVLVWVLSYLMVSTGVIGAGLHVSLVFAFWIWLGFIATVLFNSVLYERRSFTLYLINVSHYFVAIMVAAFILTKWPW